MKKIIFSFSITIFFLFGTICCFSLSFQHPLVHQDASSYKIDNQLINTQWLDTQNQSLKQVKKTAKNKQKIRLIFAKIHDFSTHIQKQTRDAEHHNHKKKNRTRLYLPYDENRTCREIDDFYVSASDVVAFSHHYIVAQAPLEETLKDFWKALLYRDSRLIITAAMPVEEKETKAYPYWIKEEFPVKTDGWIITHSGAEDCVLHKKGQGRIVRRTFYAEHKKNSEKRGELRTITQLHYENWPDNDAPCFELFCKLLDEADLFPHSKKNPILVHCSAGVGRSGTFVASHSLRHELRRQKQHLSNKDLQINIPELVLSLRKQRKGMVATRKQLQTIYQVAALEL